MRHGASETPDHKSLHVEMIGVIASVNWCARSHTFNWRRGPGRSQASRRRRTVDSVRLQIRGGAPCAAALLHQPTLISLKFAPEGALSRQPRRNTPVPCQRPSESTVVAVIRRRPLQTAGGVLGAPKTKQTFAVRKKSAATRVLDDRRFAAGEITNGPVAHPCSVEGDVRCLGAAEFATRLLNILPI